eukprot:TRINITY_DN4027_c0_g1_i2.p1 TRINITY_DN4027_c0_g1~~TRINITY_DN4027_c0_g1_i2.p1  ORF type:complete len:451 (-),score=92.04 TRINITY_DN4027_c0_g1_i2:115-1467(-)
MKISRDWSEEIAEGDKYYYNSKTGETQWTWPEEVPHPEQNDTARDNDDEISIKHIEIEDLNESCPPKPPSFLHAESAPTTNGKHENENDEFKDPIKHSNSSPELVSTTNSNAMTFGSMFQRLTSFVKDIPRIINQKLQGKPQFFCSICLENEDIENQVTLPSCKHDFCKECISDYITHKIKSGQVFNENMECPHRGDGLTCSCEIPDDFIKENVSEDIYKKMLRFRELKLNNDARMCPKCEFVQCGNAKHPSMICEECETEYCFQHSDAHPGETCQDFEKKMTKRVRDDEKKVRDESVACPGCEAPVYKLSGCNHMKCCVCSTNFCWICGRKVDSDTFPTHYAWWNIFGCPKMQMRDNISPNIRCKLWLMRIGLFLALLILGPIIIALILVLIVAFIVLWPVVVILAFPFSLYQCIKSDNKGTAAFGMCCFPLYGCLSMVYVITNYDEDD